MKLPAFILACMLCSSSHGQDVTGQKQIEGFFGLSYAASFDKSFSKSAGQLEFGALQMLGKQYGIGLKVGLVAVPTTSTPVDIPNNLLADETVESNSSLVTIAMINHFEFSPGSKARFYAETNVGIRLSSFKMMHYGYLWLFRSQETLYDKNSAGISGEIALGCYIPLKTKKFRKSLRVHTGLLAGSAITYIDPSGFSYDGTSTIIPPEKSSYASFWVSGLDYIIILGK